MRLGRKKLNGGQTFRPITSLDRFPLPMMHALLRQFTASCLIYAGASVFASGLPPLQQVLHSKLDLWGETALRQSGGPNYQFFQALLPPPRYVNADFLYYPLVLSAPRSETKARLISNGRGINLRGGARSWHDPGLPIVFRVGPDELRFGEHAYQLEHPTLAEGYLPIYSIRYKHGSETYQLEAFASTESSWAEKGLVLVKCSLAAGANGIFTSQLESDFPLFFQNGTLQNQSGEVLLQAGPNWTWARNRLHARVSLQRPAFLAIPTLPLPSAFPFAVDESFFEKQRRSCLETWNGILAQGMNVEVPEEYVNHAWKNLVIQNFALIQNDRIHYSAGNQYDKLYEAEGSDAMKGLLIWGYEEESRKLIPSLFEFTRPGLLFHQAGFKLDNLCHFYWQTRDGDFVERMRPYWEKELDLLLQNRTNRSGLLPKEQYCGDIKTAVHTLNSNARGWRAIREIGRIIAEMGNIERGRELQETAARFRADILGAIEQNLVSDTDPPFLPIALFYGEGPHDPITESVIGSYWNLVINYVIYSGIFPPGSSQESWIPRYLETHGGLCMGMPRTAKPGQTFWTGPHRTVPLYGTGYVLDLLRRDNPDRALVSFYGMLAQGMTRNTFVGGEATSIEPLDPGGRIFYCPPNSAGNSHFLQMLRHLLVQDWDVDDDGEPETLRLLFATPRPWLAQGKTISIQAAPTVFGPVSIRVQSKLDQNLVFADLNLPERNPPEKVLLRLRLPDGWQNISGESGHVSLKPDANGTFDLSNLKGKQQIRFKVKSRNE